MENNREMMQAYRLLRNTNTSFFLTGRAGTGKTTFVKNAQKEIHKNFIVLAPTGVAAINAGGMTIHSFFGFEPKVLTPYDRASVNRDNYKIPRAADTIIIDEVSMVRCDVIDAINRTLQKCMKNILPFGGKQMLFVGDMFQLEPIVSTDDKEEMKKLYGDRKPFFFNADVFSHITINPIELRQVYRQVDERFISLLDNVRNEAIGSSDLQILNKCVGKQCDDNKAIITLTSKNSIARKINESKLTQMPEPEYVFEGIVEGDFNVDKIAVTEKILHLRVGAQVMFTRNDTLKRWVNGTLGKIEKIENNVITVKLNDGKEHIVNRVTWEKMKYTYNKSTKTVEKEVIGAFTQFPLKLAWAITIHKSQGLTFDQVKIDLSGGVFAPGQTYVALSRARSLDGLYLQKPILAKHVITHKDVLDLASSFNDDERLEEEISVGEDIFDMLKRLDYDAAAYVLFTRGVDKFQNNASSQDVARFFNRALDCIVCDDKFFECLKGCDKAIWDKYEKEDESSLFVSAFIALYTKKYDEAITTCDKYIQQYGESENILYIKARACKLAADYETADKLHDEIMSKFNNGINLKVMYRGGILNEEYCHIDGLSVLVQLVDLAPHTTSLHTIIRKLMRARNIKLTSVEPTENEIFSAFNNAELDNEEYMKVVMSHYMENDDIYKTFVEIISNQIFS